MFPEAKICIYIETRKSPQKKKKLNGAFAKRSLQKRACSATAQAPVRGRSGHWKRTCRGGGENRVVPHHPMRRAAQADEACRVEG